MSQQEYNNWVATTSSIMQETFCGGDYISPNERHFIERFRHQPVLDIGCGTGNRLGNYCQQLQIEWQGVEKFANLINQSRWADRIVVGDIASDDFKIEGRFGLCVLFGGVINAFIDDQSRNIAWQNINRLAKNNADFILVDTITQFPWFRDALYGQSIRIHPSAPPQYFYSEPELQELFKQHGLDVVEKRDDQDKAAFRRHYLLKAADAGSQ